MTSSNQSVTLCPKRAVRQREHRQAWPPGKDLARRHCSGPDRVQDELDIVSLAPAASCRAAEIAPEDGRQRPIVREVEIADGGNGDVEVDGVDTSPEYAFGDAAPQDVVEQLHERAV